MRTQSHRGSGIQRRGRAHLPVHLHGSERQRQIVEIALDLVAARGADSVSIQAIADELGVTQPAVFRHFPNKEAIWAAVMDWLAENLRNIHSAAELQSDESPLAILRTIFLDHVGMIGAIRRWPRWSSPTTCACSFPRSRKDSPASTTAIKRASWICSRAPRTRNSSRPLRRR